MKRSTRRVFLVALALPLVLAASALPVAAHGFGPAFYCDVGTLKNCTDTGDPASAGDFFSCEGKAQDVVSCTNRLTGEASPYCEFLGYEPSKDQDAYLCKPTPAPAEDEHGG